MIHNQLKYKIAYTLNGCWYVVVVTKSGEEDIFFGFRDETHRAALD